MGDIDMDIDMEELGLGGGMRAEVEQEVPRGSRDGRDSRDAYTAPLRELMAEDLEGAILNTEAALLPQGKRRALINALKRLQSKVSGRIEDGEKASKA
mmetsp:Transcript_6653/g.15209  ORF Transcript_6653/g.15209 Transcript_6653/m.15209 type:complete len:98 (+) Transcript_6653:258-551(+)